MPRFLLLAYERADAFEGVPAEEFPSIVRRYVEWTKRLKKGGRLLNGEKLADGEGRSLSRRRGKVAVRDGPFAETKELIGGFWLIQAADYEEAVELARDCPHVEYGHLVIRRIDAG